MLPITDVHVKTLIENGSKFRGFELCTPYKSTNVYALIEDFQSCCETYGFCIIVENDKSIKQYEVCCPNSSSVEEQDLSKLRQMLVGLHIFDVGWEKVSPPSRKYPPTNTLGVCIRTMSDITIKLKLFNTHNGYYYHDTIVNWDGVCDDTNAL